MSVFDSPLLLGFGALEQRLERLARLSADGYPPYNIEQRADGRLRITVAVAGFDEDSLEVLLRDGQLILRGRQPPEARARRYLYRGIAGRRFQRVFMLAEGMRVGEAVLARGLLHVDIDPPPRAAEARTIPIRRAEAGRPAR